jgi:DhnA family fructose-bisphosphate aldolase class Ia
MDAGAAGVTYGRFVITYPHITALVKTLSQVIHNGMSVKEAMTLLSHLEHEEENCK